MVSAGQKLYVIMFKLKMRWAELIKLLQVLAAYNLCQVVLPCAAQCGDIPVWQKTCSNKINKVSSTDPQNQQVINRPTKSGQIRKWQISHDGSVLNLSL